MNEHLAVRKMALNSDLLFPQSAGKRSNAMALAAGLVLALSFALLLCFAPRAWADAGEYKLTESTQKSLIVTYDSIVRGFKGADGRINHSIGASYKVLEKDGSCASDGSWASDFRDWDQGGGLFKSGDFDFDGKRIPFLVHDWSTEGKPFTLFVNGQQVASSDTGGEVQHFSVSWYASMERSIVRDGMIASASIEVNGWTQDRSQQTSYARADAPRMHSQVPVDEQRYFPTYTCVHVGITQFVQLVLYDSTYVPDSPDQPPAVSLEHEDGTAYAEGTWTNKSVVVEATSNVRQQVNNGYYVGLYEADGKMEVARSSMVAWPLEGLKARHIVGGSTPLQGVSYFGDVRYENGLVLRPASAAKTVKVDKEAPVISGISASGGAASVSASDALSGVATIEGRGLGSDDWVPIGEISLSGKSGTLSVRVTDNAGNTTVGTVSVRGGNIDPPDGGGDDGSDAGSREGDGFRARRSA